MHNKQLTTDNRKHEPRDIYTPRALVLVALCSSFTEQRVAAHISQSSRDRLRDAAMPRLHRVQKLANLFSDAFFLSTNTGDWEKPLRPRILSRKILRHINERPDKA